MQNRKTPKSDANAERFERQLFSVVQNVEIPAVPDFDNETGTYCEAQPDVRPAMVFMQWPDGFPCVEMELYLMWLADTGLSVDHRGGSVRQEAVKLSHLVRYCYSNKINFWELKTKKFSDFLFELVKEKDRNGKNRREANQVIEISDSSVRFILWLQDYLLPHRRIADVDGKPNQIELILKTTVDNRNIPHSSIHFKKNPNPSSRRLKTPIPKESIDKLFHIAKERSDAQNSHPRYARRFSSREHLETYLKFQRKTWEAVLSILLAVGCRPSELEEMKVSDNLEPLKFQKSIILSTKKREPEAKRKIPVMMNLVIQLSLYIKARGDYLNYLRKHGFNPKPEDALFLNSQGFPMTKEALTQGFRRLRLQAGIAERTCLSMFRHRAITTLVAIHLKEFVSCRSDEVIHAMNDGDYSTVLAKVAAITGHRDPESLRDYIHLAWEELGKFDAVKAAIALHTMMLTLLHELAPALEELESASLDEKEAWFRERERWFRLVTDDMKESVEVFRYLQVDEQIQREPAT
jgi:integrase